MKRYLSILSIVLLALCSCSKDPKGGDEPDPDPVETPTSNELLACSFNLRVASGDDGDNVWANRKNAALKFIKKKMPDVIGLQEVQYVQSTDLESGLSSDYGYYNINRDSGLPIDSKGGEAVGILYRKDRFLLVKKGFYWLAPQPDELPATIPWGAGCRRIVVWVKLKDQWHDGRTVYFYATHFDHKSSEARLNSSNLFLSQLKTQLGLPVVKAETSPLFLVGDLNCTYEKAALQPLVKEMEYARTAAPETDNSRTHNGFTTDGGSIIDHIFYVGDVKPLVYSVANENYGVPYISDHYPILFKCSYNN